MRIIVDYRPALRARSGVGEYVHQTARALALRYPDDSLTLFTSSWKDRPEPGAASACPGARVSDHLFPVSVLNFAWHRLEWPSIELVTHRRYDVAFSPHPLLLPTRHAAQVVMVHDLDFLRHPERTQREGQQLAPAPPFAIGEEAGAASVVPKRRVQALHARVRVARKPPMCKIERSDPVDASYS